MIRYLVDGYNVLFSRESAWKRMGGEELRAERRRLTTETGRFGRQAGAKVTLVFDGGKEGSWRTRREEEEGVEVIYASADGSADDWIIEEVRRRKGSRNLVVVSDDSAIRRAAQKARVRAVGSREFVREMRRGRQKPESEGEPRAKFVGLSESEVREWQRFFQADEDT
ncbi:MAG: NYN domain-containing protein [Planctomycetota bacterium]